MSEGLFPCRRVVMLCVVVKFVMSIEKGYMRMENV